MVSQWWQNIHFWWNCPFNRFSDSLTQSPPPVPSAVSWSSSVCLSHCGCVGSSALTPLSPAGKHKAHVLQINEADRAAVLKVCSWYIRHQAFIHNNITCGQLLTWFSPWLEWRRGIVLQGSGWCTGPAGTHAGEGEETQLIWKELMSPADLAHMASRGKQIRKYYSFLFKIQKLFKSGEWGRLAKTQAFSD